MVTPVQGLGHTLQMQVVEATPERVVMTMPVTAQHLQPWAICMVVQALHSLRRLQQPARF